MRGGAFLSLWLLLVLAVPDRAADFRGYLETHCIDCHDSATKKGGLDLESLSMQLDSQEAFAKWALVHDRIAAGEMPPKSRESRPSEQENADALKRLDARLHDADIARIAKNGRALFRRLTTQEFENALRDLLYLPGLRIKQLLPEDERRHGYNKIGQALDLSNVHLSQFMDAADVALAAAIATRSTPREHLKHSMIGETRAYLRKMITHDLSVTHLVKSDFAMLNQSLSVHYGISGVTGCAIRRIVLPTDSPRGAFLTQAAVLKVTANGTTTTGVSGNGVLKETIVQRVGTFEL
jgi:hypothetical protein